MKALLDAVSDMAAMVSPDKANAIASRIRQASSVYAKSTLTGVVGTPAAAAAMERLVHAWQVSPISAIELSAMLVTASHVNSRATSAQSLELVWTGPTSPFVSARRTEQALLQVINSAERKLFITSFVAYDVSSIVKALNAATARGVSVSMLLELAKEHGGSIDFDVIGKMRVLVPAASLYAWTQKEESYSEGRVHAKVAVSDGVRCFITSANLTGYAMEKNMEAGVLITGGHIPKQLDDHLRSLVDIDVISPV